MSAGLFGPKPLADRDGADRLHRPRLTGRRRAVTVTGSTERTVAENEAWGQRWRNRGLLVGFATVVAAMAGVCQLYGWVPWK